MSALIRAATEGAAIQSHAWPGLAPEPAQIDPRLQAMADEITDLKRHMVEQQVAHRQAEALARAEARLEAEAAYQTQDAQHLALLEHSLLAASEELMLQLRTLGDAAPLLCLVALEKVFGPSGSTPELVAQALTRQIEGLRRDALISVEVSAADFPDDDALSLLEKQISSISISAKADLDAGCCRITLRLGQIEISLPGYWAELRVRLLSLSEGNT